MASSWVEKCSSLRAKDSTLADYLDVPLQICPDATAVIFEDREITYQELDFEANRTANALIGLGVDPGDRVAVHVDNCPEFITIFLGIMRTGAVIVPTNVMYKSEEMEHILGDSGATVLFILHSLSSKVRAAVDKLPELHHVIELGKPGLDGSVSLEDTMASASTKRPPVRVRPDDLAMIQYTSGTTGKPKGAMITHRNVTSMIDNTASLDRLNIREGAVALIVLPLFHSFGLNACLGRSLSFALPVVLVNRFKAADILSHIEQYRVNVFWGVPPMYVAFLNVPDLDKYDLSSLRRVTAGGSPLPAVISQEFEEATGLRIMEGYGLTEAAPTLTLPAAGPVTKRGSVGPPIPGVELRLLDDRGNEVRSGDVGEVCCRGDNFFQGYWRNEEATAETLRDGWLHTGDLGRVDEDGYLYLVDRKKDMVLVSGFNVYPIEVENVILRHPDVADCAVVGVPDPYQGESICAVVVVESGAQPDPDGIVDFCKENLAAFKAPKSVVFRETLPRNVTGKILKHVLRDELRHPER